MRSLSLFVILFLAIGAQAATTHTTRKTTTTTTTTTTAANGSKETSTNTSSTSYKPELNAILKKTSVSVYTSTASTLTLGSSKVADDNGTARSGSGELSTEAAFGLNARYTDLIREKISFFGGLSVDARREVSSLKFNGANIVFGEKPAFRPFIAEAGLRYDINNKVYVNAGFNYTLYNMLSNGLLNSLSMDPALGYQAGVGGSPVDHFAVELQYRDVRYTSFSGHLKGDTTRFEGSDVALAGLNLGARYSF